MKSSFVFYSISLMVGAGLFSMLRREARVLAMSTVSSSLLIDYERSKSYKLNISSAFSSRVA